MTKGQLAIIHIAKQQLALEDETYRDILSRVAQVASATELDSYGFDAVMETFRRLGFVSTSKRKPFGWDRPGMASNQQVRLIRALWAEFTDGAGDDASLGKWLERTFHVSAFRFLTAPDARKAITALKAMKKRKQTAKSETIAA